MDSNDLYINGAQIVFGILIAFLVVYHSMEIFRRKE